MEKWLAPPRRQVTQNSSWKTELFLDVPAANNPDVHRDLKMKIELYEWRQSQWAFANGL